MMVIRLVLWSLAVLMLASCTPHKPEIPRTPQGFSGWISDATGRPVANATIDVNGKATRSARDGSFELAVATQAQYILSITHPDFADLAHTTRSTLPKQTWTLARAHVTTVDPSAPIAIADERPELGRRGLEGATFRLPPNALVDPQGAPAVGTVRAAIATLDLANGEGPGDWAVRSDDGRREGYLVSYGAVFIQFSHPTSGVKYQLRSGMAGELVLPVLPTMRGQVGAAPAAPFWYFDTKDGYWKKAGAAVFDAAIGAYRGSVSHLSTINTDIAKFDNAACLAITLDPTIALGSKLRVRYHSEGTAFGQVPTFVMDATLNAAYRLPALTNVLLEVLTASDEVYGNLVVEDPAGTPLVNDVVNTGPALAPGDSLWPPSPFVTCKPIVLRLETTAVELRINELSTAPRLRDDPTDDYITWAPTFALARLAAPGPSDVNVVLTNDDPNIGGNVRFAAQQTPWPANTTANATSLAFTLPADGSWVPFVIAGEFGAPSTDDKDAIIEAHLDTAIGTQVGDKALMVRIRKNANELSTSERDRFLFAWKGFRNKIGGLHYVLAQEAHRLASSAGDEAHMQPAFLTWHRAFLLLVERELQSIDPSVALHYWDWDAAAPNVFTADFMGAPGSDPSDSVAEPEFTPANPLNGWNTDLPFNGGELRRNEDDHTRDPAGAMKPLDHPVDPSLIDFDDYGPTSSSPFAVSSFSDDVEKSSHNPSHGWPCGGGHLAFPSRSAADPLFYLLHSQIDRQWAYFQREHGRSGVASGGALTFPAPEHYDNSGAWNSPGNVADANFRQQGSFLEDGLWPWDGATGGAVATPQERPLNQAPAGGTNIPLSLPLIPSTPFPASLQPNRWPATDIVPLNRHMIDYLGRFNPLDGLSFGYDDVAY